MQAIYDSFNSNDSVLYAHFSSLEMTIAVAIFAIGGMLGALPAGLIADTLGRYTYVYKLCHTSLIPSPDSKLFNVGMLLYIYTGAYKTSYEASVSH